MTRIFLIAAVFSFGTIATQAASACQGHSKQAMSCAEGTSYDSETQTCVPQTTS